MINALLLVPLLVILQRMALSLKNLVFILFYHVYHLYHQRALEFYGINYDVARLTTDIYLSDLHLLPSHAYNQIARKKVERVMIDHLEGRITVCMITPYPSGIPLLIPGKYSIRKL